MSGQSASASGGNWAGLLDSASKIFQAFGGSGGDSSSVGNSYGQYGYTGMALFGDKSSAAEANSIVAKTYAQQANAEKTAAKQIATSIGGPYGAAAAVIVDVASKPFLAYRQAKYEKKMYGMRAELSEMTATQYQTAAEGVIKASHTQVASITHQAGQAKASTRVSQAAGGIRVSGSGSAAEVLTSQDIARDMAVNQTITNGITQSFGYQRKKVESQIDALGLRAAQDAVSPWVAALGTLTDPKTAINAASELFGSYFGASGAGGSSGLSNLGFTQSPGN